MTGGQGEPQDWISRRRRNGAAGVDHPELERVALFIGNGTIGVATDDERPLELGVRARGAR